MPTEAERLAAILMDDPMLGQSDPLLWSGRTTREQATRELAVRLLAAGVGFPASERVAALTFDQFARTNRERCESPVGFNHPVGAWSTSDWFLAAMGEFGEAANKAKKLNRVRDGIPGNTETPDELRAGLADEIADTVIYLDLLAQSLGFDLGAIVADKFNRTSERIDAPHRLEPAALEPAPADTLPAMCPTCHGMPCTCEPTP